MNENNHSHYLKKGKKKRHASYIHTIFEEKEEAIIQ